MSSNIVGDYTWKILKKQLQNFKVGNKVLYSIINNVKEQLNSFILNYNDDEISHIPLDRHDIEISYLNMFKS